MTGTVPRGREAQQEHPEFLGRVGANREMALSGFGRPMSPGFLDCHASGGRALSVEIRPSLATYAFDATQFEELRRQVDTGALDPEANRLGEAPAPLEVPPTDLRDGADLDRKGLATRGEHALRAGKVAVLILNGGMATRFGGGAKGIVPVLEGHEHLSFLAIKLAEIHQRARSLDCEIPAVLMHSFATQAASEAHLKAIDWGGLPQSCRFAFAQSIMPRVLPDGTPLAELPGAHELPDTTLFSAPGHGDTLGRLRASGVLRRLVARGVEHILVSNVDNVGASLDPFILGAHLDAVSKGAEMSVEVVRREAGDAGGCIATLPGSGMTAIVEGFRLPVGTDLSDYPHFNTNTLWLSLAAVDQNLPLTWFAVRKKIEWPADSRDLKLPLVDGKLEIVQFERLIGQATEFIPSAYLEVERSRRFLPIKTREDLAQAAQEMDRFARQAGLLE